MFIYNTLNQPQLFTPLVLLLMALIINSLAGQMVLFQHLKECSLIALGNLIEWFDLKLNRDHRSPLDRAIRGAVTSMLIILLSGILGLGITWLSINLPFGWLCELLLLLIVLDQKNTYKQVLEVNYALNSPNIDNAKLSLANITTKPLGKLDSYSIARIAIEFLATSLVTRVLAPIFYYSFFGPIGLAVYHAITVLNDRIGKKTEHYQHFGFSASRLSFIILFIPNLLSGPLIIFASLFVPTADPIKSFNIMLKYTDRFHSFNLGIALSAFAGALGLALCGPKDYIGIRKNERWIGDGTAKITHNDVQKCLYLFWTTCLINGLLIISLIIFGNL